MKRSCSLSLFLLVLLVALEFRSFIISECFEVLHFLRRGRVFDFLFFSGMALVAVYRGSLLLQVGKSIDTFALQRRSCPRTHGSALHLTGASLLFATAAAQGSLNRVVESVLVSGFVAVLGRHFSRRLVNRDARTLAHHLRLAVGLRSVLSRGRLS